jgi:hypothetical protein
LTKGIASNENTKFMHIKGNNDKSHEMAHRLGKNLSAAIQQIKD